MEISVVKCFATRNIYALPPVGGWMVVRVVGGDRSGRHDDQADDVGGKLIGQQEVLLVNHH